MLVKETGSQELLPALAEVVSVTELTRRETLFTLRPRAETGRFGFVPGQFVMVSIFGIGEAPISISSSPLDSSDTIELCVRAVGNLTRAMHGLEAGSTLGVRGPYGNGFPLESFEGRDILIVAGGLGLAPLRSLIDFLRQKRSSFGRIIVMVGAQKPEDIFYRDKLSEWQQDESIEVHVTVDVAEPGWEGDVGLITTLFERVSIDPLSTVAAVVGPPVMYRFVINEFLRLGIFESNIYLSLERRMRCGVGRCGHCQINGIYLCQHGPVLTYTEARKLREAF